jgi:hypothetical protein
LPLLLVAAAIFFGCNGSLSTYHAPAEGMMINGMAYYLPVGKITIKGEFASETTQSTGTDNKSDNTDTTENLAATQESSPSGKTPGKKTEESDSKTPAKDATGDAISIAGLTLSISSEVEADMDAGRYAIHVPNAMFEDEIKLSVNSKHLLSAGKATTEDKTAEIVGTVASLAKAAMGVGPLMRIAKPTPTPPDKQPFYFTFYPSSAKARSEVSEQLLKRHIEFSIKEEGPAARDDVPSKGHKVDPTQGLVFRFAKIYRVHIRYPVGDKNWDASTSKNVTLLDTYRKFVLPDTGREYVFEYPRLPLVKAVNEVGFTDGMLTDLHTTRPSLIVGILSVPKAVAQAIIPGFPAPTSSGSSSGAGGSAATAKN